MRIREDELQKKKVWKSTAVSDRIQLETLNLQEKMEERRRLIIAKQSQPI